MQIVVEFCYRTLSEYKCHEWPNGGLFVTLSEAKGLVLHMGGCLLARNGILRRFAPQNDRSRISD